MKFTTQFTALRTFTTQFTTRPSRTRGYIRSYVFENAGAGATRANAMAVAGVKNVAPPAAARASAASHLRFRGSEFGFRVSCCVFHIWLVSRVVGFGGDTLSRDARAALHIEGAISCGDTYDL